MSRRMLVNLFGLLLAASLVLTACGAAPTAPVTKPTVTPVPMTVTVKVSGTSMTINLTLPKKTTFELSVAYESGSRSSQIWMEILHASAYTLDAGSWTISGRLFDSDVVVPIKVDLTPTDGSMIEVLTIGGPNEVSNSYIPAKGRVLKCNSKDIYVSVNSGDFDPNHGMAVYFGAGQTSYLSFNDADRGGDYLDFPIPADQTNWEIVSLETDGGTDRVNDNGLIAYCHR